MLGLLLHLSVGVLGFALLYMALFLTETAEGKIQNRIENLWVRVDDLSRSALSKQAAFLQEVSKTLDSVLNRLFGQRLLSAEAASASICFSTAGLVLVVLADEIYFQVPPSERLLPYAFSLTAFALLVATGMAPKPLRYAGFLWVLLVLAEEVHQGLIRYPAAVVRVYEHGKLVETLGGGFDWRLISLQFPTILGLMGGMASDFFFIALSRLYLREAERIPQAWRIVSGLVLNAAVCLLLVTPLFLARRLDDQLSDFLGMILAVIGDSNMLTALVPLLFALISLAAGVHSILWPVLAKPIYSIQRYGVARKPRLLGALGVTCLLFAWPNSPLVQVLKQLIR